MSDLRQIGTLWGMPIFQNPEIPPGAMGIMIPLGFDMISGYCDAKPVLNQKGVDYLRSLGYTVEIADREGE